MGGNQSKEDHANNLNLNDWYQVERANNTRVLASRADPRFLVQEHSIALSDQRQLQLAEELYRFRVNDPELVSANHFNVEKEDSMCSKSYTGNLYTQHIPVRLAHIVHVPFPDVLHLYNQAFNGFHRLSKRLGPFKISQDCIGVNNNHVAKVWHSPNFAEVQPHFKTQSEHEMVRNVVSLIEGNTDMYSMPKQQPSFSNFLYRENDRVGFGQAKRKLELYANYFNQGVIPRYLSCVQKAGGAEMIRRKFTEANRNGAMTQNKLQSSSVGFNQNSRYEQSMTFGPNGQNGAVYTRVATEPTLTRTEYVQVPSKLITSHVAVEAIKPASVQVSRNPELVAAPLSRTILYQEPPRVIQQPVQLRPLLLSPQPVPVIRSSRIVTQPSNGLFYSNSVKGPIIQKPNNVVVMQPIRHLNSVPARPITTVLGSNRSIAPIVPNNTQINIAQKTTQTRINSSNQLLQARNNFASNSVPTLNVNFNRSPNFGVIEQTRSNTTVFNNQNFVTNIPVIPSQPTQIINNQVIQTQRVPQPIIIQQTQAQQPIKVPVTQAPQSQQALQSNQHIQSVTSLPNQNQGQVISTSNIVAQGGISQQNIARAPVVTPQGSQAQISNSSQNRIAINQVQVQPISKSSIPSQQQQPLSVASIPSQPPASATSIPSQNQIIQGQSSQAQIASQTQIQSSQQQVQQQPSQNLGPEAYMQPMSMFLNQNITTPYNQVVLSQQQVVPAQRQQDEPRPVQVLQQSGPAQQVQQQPSQNLGPEAYMQPMTMFLNQNIATPYNQVVLSQQQVVPAQRQQYEPKQVQQIEQEQTQKIVSQEQVGPQFFMQPMTFLLNRQMPTPYNQIVLSSNSVVPVQNQVAVASSNQPIPVAYNQVATIPSQDLSVINQNQTVATEQNTRKDQNVNRTIKRATSDPLQLYTHNFAANNQPNWQFQNVLVPRQTQVAVVQQQQSTQKQQVVQQEQGELDRLRSQAAAQAFSQSSAKVIQSLSMNNFTNNTGKNQRTSWTANNTNSEAQPAYSNNSSPQQISSQQQIEQRAGNYKLDYSQNQVNLNSANSASSKYQGQSSYNQSPAKGDYNNYNYVSAYGNNLSGQGINSIGNNQSISQIMVKKSKFVDERVGYEEPREESISTSTRNFYNNLGQDSSTYSNTSNYQWNNDYANYGKATADFGKPTASEADKQYNGTTNYASKSKYDTDYNAQYNTNTYKTTDYNYTSNGDYTGGNAYTSNGYAGSAENDAGLYSNTAYNGSAEIKSNSAKNNLGTYSFGGQKDGSSDYKTLFNKYSQNNNAQGLSTNAYESEAYDGDNGYKATGGYQSSSTQYNEYKYTSSSSSNNYGSGSNNYISASSNNNYGYDDYQNGGEYVPKYSYESKKEYKQYKDGQLTAGYTVSEKQSSNKGYEITSENLLTGKVVTETGSNRFIENADLKYSMVQEDPYNVQWDPQILADLQANVHRN